MKQLIIIILTSILSKVIYCQNNNCNLLPQFLNQEAINTFFKYMPPKDTLLIIYDFTRKFKNCSQFQWREYKVNIIVDSFNSKKIINPLYTFHTSKKYFVLETFIKQKDKFKLAIIQPATGLNFEVKYEYKNDTLTMIQLKKGVM